MLRSPNAGNGCNARIVYRAGAIDNNTANNSNGVPPDCEKGQQVVSLSGRNPEHSRKEQLSSSPGDGDKQIGVDAVGLQEADTAKNNVLIKEKICSFEALYKATFICKKNVMWKDSVAGFVKNALTNCHTLHSELMNDKYRLSKYSIFTVHEKKERIIVSTRFRDRVVQRSLCDNYLTEQLTKGFIYDNCACQPGKGSDMARKRLKCHLQRFYRKHGLNGWVLKVDIHDYFGSTLHEVAKAAVAKRVPDP